MQRVIPLAELAGEFRATPVGAEKATTSDAETLLVSCERMAQYCREVLAVSDLERSTIETEFGELANEST